MIIANNTASEGGGIYVGYYSNLTVSSQSILNIFKNRAKDDGGGVYAYKLSYINVGLNVHNISQTSNSTVTSIYIYGNRANRGGGLYLESTVRTFLCLDNLINFNKNSANYGGAVYVVSKSTSQYYNSESDPECYFQSLKTITQLYNNIISNDTGMCNKQKGYPFHFSFNRANISGISLYKEDLKNCSMDGRSFEEFELLSIMSNIETSDIGSYVVRICYCENGIPDCTKQIPFIDVKTGEKQLLILLLLIEEIT